MCARFQEAPKELHMKATKWNLRHLKETQDQVLFYTTGDSFDLIVFADTGYAAFLFDQKST